MKFTKDQIQKIALSLILLIAFMWFYFNSLLGGLTVRAENAEKRKKEIEPLITQAQKEINESRRLEPEAASALDRIEWLKSCVPDAAPIAWFPPRVTEFFKRQNIKVLPRMLKAEEEFGVKGLARMTWSIDIPKTDVISLGIAIAGLENEDPIVRVEGFQVLADPEDVEFQHAALTLSVIVKK